ncbi:cysteine desulfurase family protein [Rhodopirellula sallentina SM41]|uniref:Cysteine desulfurase family protein n=2 Tax=Rhodopirellula TaxID=265488 RepID=M5TSX0_9BACT|nr:cysteine desulfurase family protein [Rhodopirellula sallentina SM41]
MLLDHPMFAVQHATSHGHRFSLTSANEHFKPIIKMPYLNHAGTSWPKPPAVACAVEKAIHTSPDQWPELFEQAHATICRFFGVGSVDQLLITPGCTSSLATAIANVPLSPGDRVLTSCWEHHALHAPLIKLENRGIRVEMVRANNSCPFDLEHLEESLKAGNVKLVAITAACNVTGDLLPYKETIHLARRYGSMTLIDAAQIAGWVDLDLNNIDADLVAFGGHKAMQTPWGIGGLFVNSNVPMDCVSSQCELPQRSVSKSNDNQRFSTKLEYCDVGSVDQFSLAGLSAACRWLSDPAREDRLSIARQQITRLRQAIEQHSKALCYGHPDETARLPSIAFGVAGHSSGTVANVLKQHRVITSGGFQCSPQSHQSLGTQANGVVRISVGIDQPEDDIDRAIEGINAALKEVER